MGGIGSTRWREHARAWRVDECAQVRIAEVRHDLHGDAAGRAEVRRALRALWPDLIVWTLDRDDEGGRAIRVEGVTASGRPDAEASVTVRLVERAPRGGRRSWFRCPRCGQHWRAEGLGCGHDGVARPPPEGSCYLGCRK